MSDLFKKTNLFFSPGFIKYKHQCKSYKPCGFTLKLIKMFVKQKLSYGILFEQ